MLRKEMGEPAYKLWFQLSILHTNRHIKTDIRKIETAKRLLGDSVKTLEKNLKRLQSQQKKVKSDLISYSALNAANDLKTVLEDLVEIKTSFNKSISSTNQYRKKLDQDQIKTKTQVKALTNKYLVLLSKRIGSHGDIWKFFQKENGAAVPPQLKKDISSEAIRLRLERAKNSKRTK